MKITLEQIKKWVDKGSYERGRVYYKKKKIHDCYRLGTMIQSKCEGSYLPYYDLRCEISDNVIVTAKCTCPVGDGGHCKHIVALLLEWKNRFHKFVDGNTLVTRLTNLNKTQLIGIISGLMQLNSEHVSFVEMQVDVISDSGSITKDYFMEKLNKIIPQTSYLDDGEIVEILELFTGQSENFMVQGELNAGILLLQAIIEHISQMYTEKIEDYNGEVAFVIDECIEKIADHYETLDDELRDEIMITLLNAELADIRRGGVEYAYRARELIISLASEHAKKQLIRIVSSMIREGRGKKNRDWELRNYHELLEELQQIS
jgi:hypothetical protein